MNLDGTEYYTCDVCGRLVADDDCHLFHDDDCPNRSSHLTGHWSTDCDCDNRAHPDCCPACAEHVIYTDYMKRWDSWWTGTVAGWSIDFSRAHRYADKYRALAAIERMPSNLFTEGAIAIPLSMAKEMVR